MATFHMFPDLPTELRLLIWEHTMEPRVVDFMWWGKYTKCYADDGDYSPSLRHGMLFCSPDTPAIFYICRESRSVGEMHYRKTSVCRHPRSQLGQPCNYLWVNFDIDTVQIEVTSIPDPDRPSNFPARHLIQRLQVLSDDIAMDYFSNYGPRFVHFPALKSVDFIHDSNMGNWYSGIADPEEEYLWGCDPRIVRIIAKDTGEVLDYDRDKEINDFDDVTNYCPDTCVHVGSHDWDWAIDDGSWYRRLFGDV